MKNNDNNIRKSNEGLIVLSNPKKKKTSRNEIKASSSNSPMLKNKKIYQNGRWQSCEHSRFVKALTFYGNNWKKVFINLI